MANDFQYDVFLSHSTKDKAVVRALAERLRADGLRVWFDACEIKPGDSIPAKLEGGLEESRVLVLCLSAHALGSDWATMESQTFRFRDPLNKERRFIPLRLDEAPIKGSLAQFAYINWQAAEREQEYAKLLEACRPPSEQDAKKEPGQRTVELNTDPASEVFSGDCADFFHSRFEKAFPGLRQELIWFTDKISIGNRLGRLLKRPLRFGNSSPIWKFRGIETSAIQVFDRIDEETWLMNREELIIDRIAAYARLTYWRCFVYVEAKAAAPSGAYGVSEQYIEEAAQKLGYSFEEVCLFRGRHLKREFFDDGAAEIDGQLIDLGSAATLRRRYLSRYNFVVVPQDSPRNDVHLDSEFGELLNGILKSHEKIAALAAKMETLPRIQLRRGR